MTRVVVGIVAGASILAGCTSTPPVEAPASTTAASDGPRAQVARRDFSVRLSLDAATRTSAAVQVRMPSGISFSPKVARDTNVTAGQALGAAAIDAAQLQAMPKQQQEALREQLTAFVGPLTAPVAGRVQASPSQVTIQSPGMDVVASLTPLQSLRLRSVRGSATAQVETVMGPRRVPCTAWWLADETGAAPKESSAASTGGTLSCRLPGGVESAPGLRAQVFFAGDLVKQALVVPNVMMGYDPKTDSSFVVIDDQGTRRRVDVRPGPTDGVVRVVRGDVEAGQPLVAPDAPTP